MKLSENKTVKWLTLIWHCFLGAICFSSHMHSSTNGERSGSHQKFLVASKQTSVHFS